MTHCPYPGGRDRLHWGSGGQCMSDEQHFKLPIDEMALRTLRNNCPPCSDTLRTQRDDAAKARQYDHAQELHFQKLQTIQE